MDEQELSGLLYYPEEYSGDPLPPDPVEIPVSQYNNIRSHQIDNFYERYIPQITAHKGNLVKITPIIQYEDTYNKRDTYDLECICVAGHPYICKPETLVTGMWCKKCSDLRISQDPERNKTISKTMKEFYSTEEGKKKKQQSFKVRRETMEKKKAEIQNTITHKICKKCNQNLSVSEYNKKSDAKDGFQSYCKACKKNEINQKKENKDKK
jgi:hypothetical protein